MVRARGGGKNFGERSRPSGPRPGPCLQRRNNAYAVRIVHRVLHSASSELAICFAPAWARPHCGGEARDRSPGRSSTSAWIRKAACSLRRFVVGWLSQVPSNAFKAAPRHPRPSIRNDQLVDRVNTLGTRQTCTSNARPVDGGLRGSDSGDQEVQVSSSACALTPQCGQVTDGLPHQKRGVRNSINLAHCRPHPAPRRRGSSPGRGRTSALRTSSAKPRSTHPAEGQAELRNWAMSNTPVLAIPPMGRRMPKLTLRQGGNAFKSRRWCRLARKVPAVPPWQTRNGARSPGPIPASGLARKQPRPARDRSYLPFLRACAQVLDAVDAVRALIVACLRQ